MKTFNEIPKLLPQDEAFFRNFLQQNASLLGIILTKKFEIKEGKYKFIENFSAVKKVTIQRYTYSMFYLLDTEKEKLLFYFYYEG